MLINITTSNNIKKQYNITSNLIEIGRDPGNNIVIPDKKVSRSHLIIIKDKNTYKVRDPGSRNGTYINGKKLMPDKLYLLNEGDIIKIGDTTLFILPSELKKGVRKSVLLSLAILLSVIVIIAVVLTVFFINKMKEKKLDSTETETEQEEIREEGTEEEEETIDTTEEDIPIQSSLDIDKILQQVVDIYILTNDNLEGEGSGTIYSNDGYIITNYHVIVGADVINVKTFNKKEYAAEVILTNSEIDIAIIKINVENLTPAILGNSKDIKLGDEVIAIGSPYGLTSTITKGIISSIRDFEIEDIKIVNAIQHDAAINPGNSGGPLINSIGEVIGINSYFISPDYSDTGLNFAIPIDLVKEEMNSLELGGEIRN